MPRTRPRGFSFLLTLLVVLAADSLPAYARVDPPHPPVDPHRIDGSALGGIIDISSTWLVHQGDDPQYADPHLDDSRWMVVRADESVKMYGWKDVDFLWYRTHIRVPASAHDLALYLDQFGGSEEIFVNGVAVTSCGRIPPGGANIRNRYRDCPIPAAALNSQDLTIAIRGKIGQLAHYTSIKGGISSDTTVLLGTSAAIADSITLLYFRSYTSNFANVGLQCLLLLIALALALTLRTEREYLALLIYVAVEASREIFESWVDAGDVAQSTSLGGAHTVLYVVSALALLEFVRLVLKLPRSRMYAGYEWLFAVWTLVFVGALTHVMQHPSAFLFLLTLGVDRIVTLPFSAGLPVLALWVWWKRRNPDALLLFVPLVINAFLSYYSDGVFLLNLFHLPWKPLPLLPFPALYIGWSEISTFLYTVALLVFIVLRTIRVAGHRATIAAEIKAAQTMQRLLLARASQPTPGFEVESIYYPAGEVGGDFFLLSPGPDQSLTAIVGDVSGKGLAAAMRVSMILGVLRREDSRDPCEILVNLNEALLSQAESGFTTACCVRLDRSGHYDIANAGHISPYIGGSEIDTSPSLPLGLAGGQQYELTRGMLKAGQRLVLLSDGVLEARSSKGELYGFERLRLLTLKPAQEIADTAQRFGQDDDITVLTIACCA